MNDRQNGKHQKLLNDFKSGWACVTCGGYVASSVIDGFPVSRYWRQQIDPQVIEAFCSAACGLKDYEMRQCTNANIQEENV